MLISKMCIAFISTTLDTDEVFMPVQMTTIPSRVLVTFFIVMVEAKGSAPEEESLINVKLVEFIIIGERAGV